MAKSKPRTPAKPPLLSHVCEALQRIAPLELAQDWDNVGLLAGDLDAKVRKVMLCIDLTPPVADEAIAGGVDLVVAYHPPIFKPIARLTSRSKGPEAAVFLCIGRGIAVYSTHTALDAADGGTNDIIAEMCGITETQPIEYAYPREGECKIVTFVPQDNLEAVAEAMFAAGAGRIGEYGKCSYRLSGYGTFMGSDATHPAIGQAGVYEKVNEIRLEMVCATRNLPGAVEALVHAHPYEEPAYDIYALSAHPVRGAGRHGLLSKPASLAALARRLKRATRANCVQIVGDADREIRRAVILVGAAGSVPFSIPLQPNDAIVTGEIRHHDALTILRTGCTAIALNHWTSERPVLEAVGRRLSAVLPDLQAYVSEADREPFMPV